MQLFRVIVRTKSGKKSFRLVFYLTFLSVILITFPVFLFSSKRERAKNFYNSSIDDLVKEMTLEEKVGQTLMFGFKGLELDNVVKEWIKEGKLGNIKIFLRNAKTKDKFLKLINSINSCYENTDVKIPPFIAADVEGGMVDHLRRVEDRIPPSAALVAATRNLKAAELAGKLISNNLVLLGINMNFAPCFDILTNSKNRVIDTRSFGSDADSVYRFARAIIMEQEKLGVLSVVKHFPGHGMTGFDSHITVGKVKDSADELYRHILPYVKGIGEGIINGCMISNIIYKTLDPGYPAVFSPVIIQQLLKSHLGFDGLVVTDDLEMQGAEGVVSDPVEEYFLAFRAGNDIMLYAHTRSKQENVINGVVSLFENGRLNKTELDQRVRKILYLKKRYISKFKKVRIDVNSRLKIIRDSYEKLSDILVDGITLLHKSFVCSSVEFFSELKSKNVRGVVISPSLRFSNLAKKYLPGWDIFYSGYFPSKEQNRARLNKFSSMVKNYDFAVIGFATERHLSWIRFLNKYKMPYALLIIDHPLIALPYIKDSIISVTCYDSFEPALNALFYELLYGGSFNGCFPYKIKY